MRVAVVFGGGGMLATELAPALAARGFTVERAPHGECDITEPSAPMAWLSRIQPSLVVNAAAYTNVDRAESEPDAAFAVNAKGAENVALAASAVGAKLMHISTDYAFDGRKAAPYVEADPVAPMGVYARSKVEGEERVLAACPTAQVVRTGELYGDGGRNFFVAILDRARSGAPLRVVNDQVVTPTWTRELSRQLVAIAEGAPPGLYHATADGEVTWYEAAKVALQLSGLEANVEPVSTADWGSPTPRPLYSVLSHATLTRLGLYSMRPWREALAGWLLDRAARSS